MKRTIAILAFMAAASCQRPDARAPEKTSSDNNAPATTASADNTKKNERDRSSGTLTPLDQAENEADRTITQRVRQGVVQDDAVSFTGKNVKIITVDGVVTLRGPVKSEREKTDIATIAKGVDGVKRVDNQLEIAAN